MQILGFEGAYVAGVLIVAFAFIALFAVMLIAALVTLGLFSVLIFRKTKKVFIPKVTLLVISLLEAPIRNLMWLIKKDDKIIDQMLVQIRNSLYSETYKKTDYKKRAIFLPQCLRSPNCPAKLTPEGIKCVECGQCGIGEVKRVAESLGYMFFVVPGGSFVKRMVKKYNPEAILGVGCPMEVKEGTAMMASVGLPVQGVMLLKDGCVNTRVDVEDLIEKIKTGNGSQKSTPQEVEKISSKWVEKQQEPIVKIKK